MPDTYKLAQKRKGTMFQYMQKNLMIFAFANFAVVFPVSTAAVHEMCLKLVFCVMLSHQLLCLSVVPHNYECSRKPRNHLLSSVTCLWGTKYLSSGCQVFLPLSSLLPTSLHFPVVHVTYLHCLGFELDELQSSIPPHTVLSVYDILATS